jgi:hypothetical protein
MQDFCSLYVSICGETNSEQICAHGSGVQSVPFHGCTTSRSRMACDGAKLNTMSVAEGSNGRRRAPCRHFIQGRCTWGNSCRFIHELPITATVLSVRVGSGMRSETSPDPTHREVRITVAESRHPGAPAPLSPLVTRNEAPHTPHAGFPTSPPANPFSPGRYSHNPYSATVVSVTTPPSTGHTPLCTGVRSSGDFDNAPAIPTLWLGNPL